MSIRVPLRVPAAVFRRFLYGFVWSKVFRERLRVVVPDTAVTKS